MKTHATKTAMSKKVAVVTGSNKGLGFAIVKNLLKRFDGLVYLTSRDDVRGKAAVAELNNLGLKPEYHQLDVTDRNSIAKFRDHLKNKHGGLDILINNAGVAAGVEDNATYEDCKYVVDINYYAFLGMEDLLFPIVKENGRIVNISSDCGHLSNVKNRYWVERLSQKNITREEIHEFVQWFMDSKKNGTFDRNDIADGGTCASYRVTKVALCALTRIQQKELETRNISVNSMHPGLVQTDMTHNTGFLTPEQASATPIYLALDAPSSIRGAYVWHDGSILDWFDNKADYFFKSKTLY